jgi:CBS domain-containing membrane protein
MVSDVDLMASADLDVYDGLRERFRRLTAMRAGRPMVVGQIMQGRARTVSERMHIAELVPLMADLGLRHVPVGRQQAPVRDHHPIRSHRGTV